jgi:DNA-binding transcriptional regulator YdaS (Cro superfamily)
VDDARHVTLRRVTYDEFARRMSAILFDAWVSEAGLSVEQLRGFFPHGIPAEWAEAIADVTAGAIPVSDWPKVIASPRHRRTDLHKRLRSSSVNGDMNADHRLAISKGAKADAFQKAIVARGFSQNSLAKAIGINPAVLSLHRNKLRRIPKARAEEIERLTGWPADAKHWPCGIVGDGE